MQTNKKTESTQNRLKIKRGRGQEWEIEISSRATGTTIAIYISTLIAVILGLITLFSSIFQLIKDW